MVFSINNVLTVPEDLQDLSDHFMRKLINMYAIEKESTKIIYSLVIITDQRGKPFTVLMEVSWEIICIP